MMSLTKGAAHAIEGILSNPDVPDDAGLRIVVEASPEDTARQLQVVIAARPDHDDFVIERSRARVFIPSPLADMLADKCLDAEVDEEQVRFTLASQGAAA
jgi:iron-sulfur cluster assembly protein